MSRDPATPATAPDPGRRAGAGAPVSRAVVRGAPLAGSADTAGLSGALLAWRAAEGLSRLAGAQRLGISHTTLRGWEVLGVCPQPRLLPRLASVLGSDVEQLRALIGPDPVRTVRTSGGQDASPLCRARLEAGLTTTQLSLKLGVVPSTVSRWENGVRTPEPEMWSRLARALRLAPDRRDELSAASPVRRSVRVRLPGLGELRRDRGLTQRALGAALGVGTAALGRWEQGRVGVPVARLDDLAGALGVDRAALLDVGARPPRERGGQRPLAELRRAAGLTQREVALHLRVTVRTVAHWEAGTRSLPRAAARQLARLLRRPLPQVLAAAGLPAARLPSPQAWRPVELPLLVAGLRRSSGWSASGLGRRIGVSRWTLRGWETGTTMPSPSACERLELVFDLPTNSLSRLRRMLPGPGDALAAQPGVDGASSGRFAAAAGGQVQPMRTTSR